MSREVRRVVPNWEHPVYTEDNAPNRRRVGEPIEMNDQHITAAVDEWLIAFDRARNGEFNEWELSLFTNPATRFAEWLYWAKAPNPLNYRPWTDDEATWLQLWQTVSDGAPVSPPFATEDELIDYLARHGDFWDQKNFRGGWGYSRAKAMVGEGWAPSGAISNGVLLSAPDVALLMASK